ncbi:MAG: hypothetical protein AAF212_11985 [Verrucomicrobiota bacterium]
MNDSEIWKILKGIADLSAEDVVAHVSENEMPDEKTRESLKRFAAGEVDEKERNELCTQLKSNPAWVTYLADCIRELRTA